MTRNSIFSQLKFRQTVFVGLSVIFIAAIFFAVFLYQSGWGRSAKASVVCDDGTPKNCRIYGGGEYDLLAADTTFEGSNLTIDGIIVYTWGYHSFSNLTLKNGGVISHRGLISGVDFNEVLDFNQAVGWSNLRISNLNNVVQVALTDSGKSKKIFLNVSDTLKFESGGKIDADFKGFPGFPSSGLYPGLAAERPGEDCFGIYRINNSSNPDSRKNRFCGKGFGPGGGEVSQFHDEWAAGAGASYGGRGGQIDWQQSDYYSGESLPTYQDTGISANIDTNWHGSGGGSAYRHEGGYRRAGGAGGGVIHLTVGKIVSDGSVADLITANGAGGSLVPCTSSSLACGGAGSGGSIYLKIVNDQNQVNLLTSVEAGKRGATNHPTMTGTDGVSVVKDVTFNSSIVVRATAKGGDGGGNNLTGASGGGGRILIEAATGYTLKKWLEPVSRASASLVNEFNPYALRIGDRIRVNIAATNITNGAIVEDKLLTSASLLGLVRCVPYNVAQGGNYSGDNVKWTYSGAAGDTNFHYFCRVEKQ